MLCLIKKIKIMKLMNRVQLIGNLGKDPKIKNFENGKKIVRFSVATDDLIKKNGKYEKITNWVNVTAMGKNAEIAEKFLTSGTEVVIEGSLVSTTITDRSGSIRKITEVLAESILYRNIKSAIEKQNRNINNLRA